MAITKRKIDLFIKSNPIVDDYYHQSDYYDYYGSDYYDNPCPTYDDSFYDYEYDYVKDYNTINNLLLSTNLLYRKDMLDTRYSISGYKVIDMESIYGASKIRERKIDKVLGLLDDTKFSNRLGDYLKSSDERR